MEYPCRGFTSTFMLTEGVLGFKCYRDHCSHFLQVFTKVLLLKLSLIECVCYVCFLCLGLLTVRVKYYTH